MQRLEKFSTILTMFINIFNDYYLKKAAFRLLCQSYHAENKPDISFPTQEKKSA